MIRAFLARRISRYAIVRKGKCEPREGKERFRIRQTMGRVGSGVVGAALLCVAALLVAQGRTSGWHASAMLQLQQLANWSTGALGGKGSLVTQCAKGNDAACDALVNDPGAVAALQHIDAKNPTGFAAKHPHKAATLQRKFQIGQPSHMYRRAPAAAPHTARRPAHRVPEPRSYYKENRVWPQQLAHRVPELLSYYKKKRGARVEHEDAFDRAFGRMHAAKRVAEPLSYYGQGFQGAERTYKTAASTKKEWHLPAWKDGALGGGNNQWLKACAEGNYYACNQIEKHNDDVHDLLKPQHPIRPAARKAAPMLKAVYVAPHPSVWGQLMSAVGLGDSFYKNSEVLHSVPSMQPDSGLDSRGHSKVCACDMTRSFV